MSVSARRIDDWICVSDDPKQVHQTITERDDDGNIVSQKFQKSDEWTIILRRIVAGVTGRQSDVGSKRSAFQFITGPDSGFNYASTGKEFVCIANPFTLQNSVTGAYIEEQTWFYKSEWEDVDSEEFTAT
jgi:hypothetical protein